MGHFSRSARQRIEAGGLALGYFASRLRSTEAVAIAAAADFDWIFLDCELTTVTLDEIAQISLAAHYAGIATLVRTPRMQTELAGKVLGLGAGGVIFPQVETVAEARAIVEACRLPPIGRRSPAYSNHLNHFGRIPQSEAGADQGAFIGVMVETAAGVANAGQLARIEGVDLVMVGTHDLAADLGASGHEAREVIEAIIHVAETARSAGKRSGFGGLSDTVKIAAAVKAGAQIILGSTDIAYIVKGAREQAAGLRRLEQPPKP